MAENPFDPANIEQYKSFFQKAPRPNVLGTESGRAAIESERAGLASFERIAVPNCRRCGFDFQSNDAAATGP